MSAAMTVRGAVPGDATAMAAVIVQSWRETYRGIMADAVLDDPELLPRRERFWEIALTDERYRDNRAAVAIRDGEMIGVAMAGPPLDEDAWWPRQLYVLYVLEAFHGSGAARPLLDAVIDPALDAALWVADANPRAQAFYRKCGFRSDGTTTIDEGVLEIRMVRRATHDAGDREDRGPKIPRTDPGWPERS
ncbi:N-acetyltransferase family protein [Microbacterium sp. DT81.1]|uniref:GNAT family N-acetyltransferase n=1 Tax=Microbacterium sp. DT81.1 TaxID=3393413 RepID=UPI003CF07100